MRPRRPLRLQLKSSITLSYILGCLGDILSCNIFLCPVYGWPRPGSRERFTPAYIEMQSVGKRDMPWTVEVTQGIISRQVWKLSSGKLKFVLHTWKRGNKAKERSQIDSPSSFVSKSSSSNLVLPFPLSLWYCSLLGSVHYGMHLQNTTM